MRLSNPTMNEFEELHIKLDPPINDDNPALQILLQHPPIIDDELES